MGISQTVFQGDLPDCMLVFVEICLFIRGLVAWHNLKILLSVKSQTVANWFVYLLSFIDSLILWISDFLVLVRSGQLHAHSTFCCSGMYSREIKHFRSLPKRVAFYYTLFQWTCEDFVWWQLLFTFVHVSFNDHDLFSRSYKSPEIKKGVVFSHFECKFHEHLFVLGLVLVCFSWFWALKGGLGCLMSPLCLESQGCHLIPLYYLLSSSSALSRHSFCHISFFSCLLVHSHEPFPENSSIFSVRDRLFCMAPVL